MSLGLPGYVYDKVSKSDLFVGRYKKPGFMYNTITEVICEASSDHPAYFIIGGRLYIVTEDLKCNLKANGAGGLAGTRTIAASTVYYLYGVESTGTVKLVADIHDPSDGPEGFPIWTYLGGFRTESTSILFPFRSSDGLLIRNSGGADFTVGTATLAAFTLVIPETVRAVYLRAVWTTVTTAGDNLSLTGINDDATSNVYSRTNSTNAALVPIVLFWLEVITPPTVYAKTTQATDAVQVATFGWHEDISEFP